MQKYRYVLIAHIYHLNRIRGLYLKIKLFLHRLSKDALVTQIIRLVYEFYRKIIENDKSRSIIIIDFIDFKLLFIKSKPR